MTAGTIEQRSIQTVEAEIQGTKDARKTAHGATKAMHTRKLQQLEAELKEAKQAGAADVSIIEAEVDEAAKAAAEADDNGGPDYDSREDEGRDPVDDEPEAEQPEADELKPADEPKPEGMTADTGTDLGYNDSDTVDDVRVLIKRNGTVWTAASVGAVQLGSIRRDGDTKKWIGRSVHGEAAPDEFSNVSRRVVLAEIVRTHEGILTTVEADEQSVEPVAVAA